MALSQKTVQFFVNQIDNSSVQTIAGISSQLFEYLCENVKDNPVYDKYIAESANWMEWPGEDDWQMPGKLEFAKNLSFALYKRITEAGSDTLHFLYIITNEGSNVSALNAFNNHFLGYFSKALEDILNANPELAPEETEKVPGTKVFIIHGHDELLKKDLQLLLIRGGVNNIVLHEMADKGRSIIDKLIEEGKDSNYAIGLLTPDDLLQDGTGRARQNVILEIGYFLGKLGKERVRMLIKEGVEIPSDLSGILYEKYDSGGAWKTSILKELMAVGIYVDLGAAVMSL